MKKSTVGCLMILGGLFFATGEAMAYGKDLAAVVVIDEQTAARGFTLEADGFRLGITAGALVSASGVEIKKLSAMNPVSLFAAAGEQPTENLDVFYPLPPDMVRVSELYEFNLLRDESYNAKKPLWLELKQTGDERHYKEMFFWHREKSEWLRLPSKTDYENNSVKAAIHLSYAQVAVLEYKEVLGQGEASWYKYKNCDCAASPDYPKGSKLKVTNLDNNKSVIVRVNDYGPDRSIFPKRNIDLDYSAFQKLASPGLGVISTRVDRLD